MSDLNLSSIVWSVADLLRGDYKQSEYGKLILATSPFSPETTLWLIGCACTFAAIMLWRYVAGRRKEQLLQKLEAALEEKAGVYSETFGQSSTGKAFLKHFGDAARARTPGTQTGANGAIVSQLGQGHVGTAFLVQGLSHFVTQIRNCRAEAKACGTQGKSPPQIESERLILAMAMHYLERRKQLDAELGRIMLGGVVVGIVGCLIIATAESNSNIGPTELKTEHKAQTSQRPYLAHVSVTSLNDSLQLDKKGFVENTPVKPNDVLRSWQLVQGWHHYNLRLYGDSEKELSTVEALFRSSVDPKGELPLSTTFFKAVAASVDAGTEAPAWIEAHVGQTASAQLGEVALQLSFDPKTGCLLRILPNKG